MRGQSIIKESVMATYKYLQSAQDNLVIDINSNGGVQSGSPLQALVKKNEINQWWATVDVPGEAGYFWLSSPDQNLVIDINSEGGVQSGSPLQALVQKNESNQYWTTVDVPGKPGYFWLQSHDSGLVIDINSTGGIKSGSTLQALVKKNEDNQYWTWVDAAAATPPNPLGSSSNYYFSAGGSGGKPIPIMGIVVTVEFTEDLVGTPPCSLQLNAWSPSGDLDHWQQYGISMAPDSNQLNSFAENFPTSGVNLFNIEPNGFITLPNETTIPKGTKIVTELTYTSDNTGNVNGSVVTVYDGSGAKLGSQTISLIGQPLAAGGTVSEKDLAPIASFQMVLVGWANYADTVFSSGLGTISYTSSTPMTAQASAVSTGESSNSTYSVVPAAAGTFFAQSLGVDTSKAPAGPANKRLHGRPSRFVPETVS